MKFLDGYKTKIAGVAGIFWGLAMIGKAIAAGDVQPKDIWDGVLVVIAGLGTLGVGGKLQKVVDALGSGQQK